ncbi:MAG: hypothetical protein M9928_03155 [Anaerolineae bacterium]|nr:hypothetical protein [Anaerolineae bacterium]MCO5186685.1 hypothetical protein [Anaerolineae bacterium]MCO5194418.1 hypothetical protein [Anaerolineae bacterium]MCO5199269.1 hypothetical protein [Anaerolineae bacterium]MCO5204003.1 hypothetical protein [Anaerolineae bacterium]
MRNSSSARKLPLTLPQIFLIIIALVILFVIIGLNRYSGTHEAVVASRATFQAEVDVAGTRQVELQATLTYVESQMYVERYFREEEGMVLQGERRLAPNVVVVTPTPSVANSAESAAPVPVGPAYPWQMWWRLVTDAPFPNR